MPRSPSRRFAGLPSALPLPALLLAPALLMAAGCSTPGGHYPSLSPRPIEQMSLAEPTRPAPPPPVADPQALARLSPDIEQARTADEAFRRSLAEARPALAAGRRAATGSDAWVEAQQALSRVETTREPVRQILSRLDAARNAPPTEVSTGEALAAGQAYAKVQAIAADEDKALQAIWPAT